MPGILLGTRASVINKKSGDYQNIYTPVGATKLIRSDPRPYAFQELKLFCTTSWKTHKLYVCTNINVFSRVPAYSCSCT